MIATLILCATLAMSDGDSGRCRTANGDSHRIRLQGIDAGEVRPFTRCRQSPNVWACSQAARDFGEASRVRARQLAVSGARCTVVDTDRYRRNVAVCTVNGRDLGATLVREGLAISETNYGDRYRREEDEARRARRGIWR